MDASPDNPQQNKLPPGVSEQQVEEAVASSGYPLQTLVSLSLIEAGFHSVAEEWVYSDADTGELRALDLRASRFLYRPGEPQPRVRPVVELLVECKRSELPYVFFASDGHAFGGPGMNVVGLHRDELEIISDDTLDTSLCTVIQALNLDRHAFVAAPPRVALALSKVVRKGKNLTLSGIDAYQGLVLPLVKASLSLAEQEVPVDTAVYFDLGLPICVAVLDAPMLFATVAESEVVHEMVPWVRVYRHDLNPIAEHRRDRVRLHAIDCVHKEWLEHYLRDHLLPFAEDFGKKSLAHHEEIASGKGFAAGMGHNWRDGLEGRLMPRRPSDARRRAARIATNVLSLGTVALRTTLGRREG